MAPPWSNGSLSLSAMVTLLVQAFQARTTLEAQPLQMHDDHKSREEGPGLQGLPASHSSADTCFSHKPRALLMRSCLHPASLKMSFHLKFVLMTGFPEVRAAYQIHDNKIQPIKETDGVLITLSPGCFQAPVQMTQVPLLQNKEY